MSNQLNNPPAPPPTLTLPTLVAAGRTLVYRLTFFFLPLFLTRSGRNGWELGLLMSLFSFTSVCLVMPFGLFNDRVESRKLVNAGFFCAAVYYFCLKWRGDFLWQVIFFFLGGLGLTLTQISLDSLVLKGAQARRGKRFGVYQLTLTLVFAAASVAGGFLLQDFSFERVFCISGGLSCGLLLLSFALPRSRAVTSPISAYRRELSPKGRRIFALILFFFTFHWGAESTSYSLFLTRNFAFSLKLTGLYMGCSLIALGLASFLAGRYSDRLGSIRYLMAAGFLLSGACQILMVFPPPVLSFVFRVLHEVGDGIINVLIFFWVSKIFHVDRVSGHYGVVNFSLLAGQTVSTLAFGPIGAALGYTVPLWISGVIILACFFSLCRWRHTIFAGV